MWAIGKIAIATFCVALAAVPRVQAQPAGATTIAQDIPVVTVAKVQRGMIEARVPVTGSLVARDPVQIHANVAGYEIRQINAEIGDPVKKGDVLLVLDDAALKAQLAQAEAEHQRATAGVSQAESQITSGDANLVQAASALNRSRSLRQSGNVSQSVLDQAIATEASARAAAASASDGLGVARAALAQADAARQIALLNLGYARISAPVAGVIVGRTAEIGAISTAGGEPLFKLIAGGEIELDADIIETALAQIKVNDPAEVRISGMGVIAGHVRLVPAAVDPVTRLGPARIALSADPRLRIGLFASGWIITDQHEAMTVPVAAVLADEGGERVQVVRDGVVETRKVRAGLVWQGRREILEGLSPDDQVIARAGAFFRSGDHVRAVPAP